jgi:SAM-dependent methyltransferase
MIFKGVDICCPNCKGELQETGHDLPCLACISCGRQYPLLFGIPDLRTFSDPYQDIEVDRAKAAQLAERFDELSFEELVAYYYQGKKDIPSRQIQQYTRGVMTGAARSQAALDSWESMIRIKQRQSKISLLEIGCGTAPLLVAASSRSTNVVGVDIGLRWLVLGKKRLAEAGLDFPLICACAEALPFRDGVFDRVASESTLENLRDQEQGLRECYRVLRSTGYLFVSTPNRFSLGPDPHAGILAGGYLPDRWLAAYVRRQGGIPPKRRLLSYRSLGRLIRQTGFSSVTTYLPDVPAGQAKNFSGPIKAMIDFYHLVKRVPGGRQLLLWIGPLLHTVAVKQAD